MYRPTATNLLLLLLWAFLSALPAAADERPYFNYSDNLYDSAPMQEVMVLPKFCWGIYNKKMTAPQYQINSSGQCGPGMNHYCQGLLNYNRSQHPMATKSERAGYLERAIQNIDYTATAIKSYPACPIRGHVMMMKQRALQARRLSM